jgi:hypothetical protein
MSGAIPPLPLYAFVVDRDSFPVKGNVRSRTGHEGPEGEWKYSSTLSLTSALDGVDS